MSLFEGPDVIAFYVRGLPRTQGSVRAVTNRGTGRAMVVQGSSKEAQNGLSSWREAIAAEGRTWCDAHPAFVPLDGLPLQLKLTFTLARPKSAPKTRRTWPVGARSGDIDKLARAVLDALTGVLFTDDSQVVGLVTSKDYGTTPGLAVALRVLAR